MSKIKNSHKFIFNRILFKNSIIRNFTRCESLKVNTIQCKAYHGINIYRPKIAQFATQNIPVETAVLRKQGVKNLNDLKRYIDEGKQFYIKLLTNILDKIEFANISNKDAILLLECCGNSVPTLHAKREMTFV
ncbi:hypothetical protein NQ318_021039 [Aromia moschata]|uniref:Uncharacterized protein n=1 Tax=Aromia moschata TaxID=1265417 RepID=A0AAV8YMK6_9CUCU|nr:hypothetical protein NQ318_021039 [Aromia moschata]